MSKLQCIESEPGEAFYTSQPAVSIGPYYVVMSFSRALVGSDPWKRAHCPAGARATNLLLEMSHPPPEFVG